MSDKDANPCVYPSGSITMHEKVAMDCLAAMAGPAVTAASEHPYVGQQVMSLAVEAAWKMADAFMAERNRRLAQSSDEPEFVDQDEVGDDGQY